jgi:superfamily II DNA or RNA helicase
MARRGSTSDTTREARLPAEPSLLDTDLASWAGERTARGGRQDALLGRVDTLRLSLDGRTLEARVRGNRPLPYRVTVRAAGAVPSSACTCARETQRPCRHAVAALEALRFPLPRARRRARSGRRRAAGGGRIIQAAPAAPGFLILGGAERTRTREERIAQARSEALAEERRRSRGERSRVRRLDEGRGPVAYEVLPRNGQPCRVVTLRGTGDAESCTCTCDPFDRNELPVCRHVLRVRNFRTRQRKKDRATVPPDLCSVWRRPREWVDCVPDPFREIRLDAPGGSIPRGLQKYFDAEGWLGSPPAGRGAPAWAAAARAAARRAARRRSWTWDADRAVDRLVRAGRREEALARRRADVEDAAVWAGVLSGIRMRLFPYQEEGARFLACTGRAFLADDMGLGKTLQAIVAALLLRRTAGARKALVVCPASLKHQWSREILRACGEHAVVADGPRPGRLTTYRAWEEGFLILNYELVLRDLDALRRAAADLVILDEAQRIKNWNTKTARAVKRLRGPHAFVLTGTPLENRLIELHSLVEFLHPRAAGPRWRLVPFHAVTEDQGRIVAYEGLDVLRRRLRPIFLRRERGNVQDQLPERTDNTFWTGMTAAQMRPYRRHASAAAALLAERRPLAPAETRLLLRALTAMRILCNAHAQYAWAAHGGRLRRSGDAERDIRALHSPKLEEFVRVLEDLLDGSEGKVVVFSQWERMLRLAHFATGDLLERRDLRADLFHGGLSGQARTELLDAFRLDPEFRVLFSTDAGGLGLNLQEAASIVVNLEVPWNPAVLEQRVGRVHRMGQRRSVQVLHFVTRGAIEERVRQVVESKRALFEGLLVQEADEVALDASARASFLERARVLLGDVESG